MRKTHANNAGNHHSISPEEFSAAIVQKIHHHFGRDAQSATTEHFFRACAWVLRDLIVTNQYMVAQDPKEATRREVHYLSMEFLLGRSLMKNAYNLGVLPALTKALSDLGVDPDAIFEAEPDAALGNGGLGRLAACYLESLTTQNFKATGYTLCYHLGIFRQKIVDGEQVELPDSWLDLGGVWLSPQRDEAVEVRFGGHVETAHKDGHPVFVHRDYTSVLAIPMDMPVAGYQTNRVNFLRLWDAKSPVDIDMALFSRGEYMRAIEQKAMAEVICKVLYPEDNHFEGKLLRLRQQYFFVSATIQDIVRAHKKQYGHLRNFHKKHVLHINDTHPALTIPELMRILIDEEDLGWDEAWSIVSQSVAYTNHTVLSEALECWPQHIIEMLLPRIWMILCEINNRYCDDLRNRYPHDTPRLRHMAIIWDGEVRMANLCTYACYAVNGVSALHSGILRQDIFRFEHELSPQKFLNVTNGVDHRRWLAQINPPLHNLICELLGGDAYLTQPDKLYQLKDFAGDTAVQQQLMKIKRKNKEPLCRYVRDTMGIAVDPLSIFDVQVKRLHEYKRQLLNVLHILSLYHALGDNPEMEMQPRTFFFGAKAASGYHMAKRIIQLIHSVARQINNDPLVAGRIRVVFLENYRVSLAEMLFPAAELSEQISLAGKEASGTGNMKFMLNGALTIGTLDGGNVEMVEMVGEENFFLFGLKADEVKALAPDYAPTRMYSQNKKLARVVDNISLGFSDGHEYGDIASSLILHDTYMLLADFESYCAAHERVVQTYADERRWNQMSMINIAGGGYFAADRSIQEYANTIWKIK